jgi:hypothetical protein
MPPITGYSVEHRSQRKPPSLSANVPAQRGQHTAFRRSSCVAVAAFMRLERARKLPVARGGQRASKVMLPGAVGARASE